MRRFKQTKRRKYYGKGTKQLIRPTLNKGRIFVGEGLRRHYKKKNKKAFYGKGFFSGALLASAIPALLSKIKIL